jgi:glycosyltransferase involved in cell wall biosynthesis
MMKYKNRDHFVSVVIPVFNGENIIGTCIKSILKQSYPNEKYEIIIVDNGSTDTTREIIKRYPVKMLIEDSIRSSYGARNTGIKHAN